MYNLISENLKWLICGLTAICIISNMASCKKEISKSDDNMNVNIIKSYTENGYVQKQIGDSTYKLWTMPSEPVKYNDEQEVK